jgi:hypothetical protein
MILHGYGDSWTQGVGADLSVERNLSTSEEKLLFTNNHSWVKYLGDMIGTKWKNSGVSGNSNFKIFTDVINDVRGGVIQPEDQVVVMWSSSIRDPLYFLPSNRSLSSSIEDLKNGQIYDPLTWSSNERERQLLEKNNKYLEFLNEYTKFYLGNLFSEIYFYYVNQNYVICLQEVFKSYGIKNYIFCDAFESTIKNIHDSIDFTFLVNVEKYYGFDVNGNSTISDYLKSHDRYDIWEYPQNKPNKEEIWHPNKSGYKIIAEELYKFIKGM